jgi:hypothetical protein
MVTGRRVAGTLTPWNSQPIAGSPSALLEAVESEE